MEQKVRGRLVAYPGSPLASIQNGSGMEARGSLNRKEGKSHEVRGLDLEDRQLLQVQQTDGPRVDHVFALRLHAGPCGRPLGLEGRRARLLPVAMAGQAARQDVGLSQVRRPGLAAQGGKESGMNERAMAGGLNISSPAAR